MPASAAVYSGTGRNAVRLTHLNRLKISQYFAYTSGGMFPNGTSSTWAERCELRPCFTHTRVDGMLLPRVWQANCSHRPSGNWGRNLSIDKVGINQFLPEKPPPAGRRGSIHSVAGGELLWRMEGTPSPETPFWPPVIDIAVGAGGNGTSADPEISGQGFPEVCLCTYVALPVVHTTVCKCRAFGNRDRAYSLSCVVGSPQKSKQMSIRFVHPHLGIHTRG